MTDLLTAAQMRSIEAAAIESGQVTGLELMERAGQGVVEEIYREWPELDRGASPSSSPEFVSQDEGKPRAVVLCGPGNNGGDGFVVARLLAERGWQVDVFFYGDAAKLPLDAKANYDAWCGLGAVKGEMEAFGASANGFRGYRLVVDALFGIGLSRPILPYWRNTLETIEGAPPELVAVAIDLPSGFDSDTGQVVDLSADELAESFGYVDEMQVGSFDLTVTFHRQKIAHQKEPCRRHCGKVVVVDLGL